MLNAPTDALAIERAAETPPAPRVDWGRRWFLAALLGPTALVVLAVVAFPFVYNVAISFSNMNIYTLRDWEMIGLDQYVAVFAEPAFWAVLAKTLIWTVVNVGFHVGLGVFLAVILHQSFIRGKSAWRVLLILP